MLNAITTWAMPLNRNYILFAVPEFCWAFDMEVDCVNRKLYQRLEKIHRVGAPYIWVSIELLKQTQAAAKNIDTYARDLTWNVLIPLGERAR